MQVPYTTKTGIKIGVRYMEQGKRDPIDDKDMQYLQEALLATPDYISSKRKYELTLALSMFSLVATVVAIFLLN
jgi:hypothetical protein